MWKWEWPCLHVESAYTTWRMIYSLATFICSVFMHFAVYRRNGHRRQIRKLSRRHATTNAWILISRRINPNKDVLTNAKWSARKIIHRNGYNLLPGGDLQIILQHRIWINKWVTCNRKLYKLRLNANPV